MSKIKDFLKSPLGTALCAAAACLLAVVLVWLAAVRPNNDKSLSERISDDYSQYSAELDEANGAAQTFDTDNDLLAMAFVFGTSNGQPTGELHLELADADTGEVLARSTGDMANIVAGQYTGMGLDTPVTGSAGRRYRVTLKPEYTGSGRLTVGCSNGAVLWNDTFTVNGEAVDGTLALLVTYKQIGGFLTRFFLLVGLLASVVVFLGIYFAMRGRMPLHRLVFVLVLCFGMLYSFVLPPYAAPDEKYHINQSFTLACKWANMLSPDEWRMGNVPLDMTYRREHDFDPLLQNEKTTVFSWQELSENLFTTTPDSFDSHTALEELQSKYGIFAVFGNHEFYNGLMPWQFKFGKMGWSALFNYGLPVKDTELYVGGVPDVSIARGSPFFKIDVDRTLENSSDGQYKILLSHTPRFQKEMITKAQYDLQLSGHTHGGQIFPFHLLVKQANKYLAGLYDVNDTKLYLSRGAGYWGPPMRLFAPSEITVIRLKPEK